MSVSVDFEANGVHPGHVIILRTPASVFKGSGEPFAVKHDVVRYDELGLAIGDGVIPQDEMAWIGQGPIMDRTQEHLATSDKGVALFHAGAPHANALRARDHGVTFCAMSPE